MKCRYLRKNTESTNIKYMFSGTKIASKQYLSFTKEQDNSHLILDTRVKLQPAANALITPVKIC